MIATPTRRPLNVREERAFGTSEQDAKLVYARAKYVRGLYVLANQVTDVHPISNQIRWRWFDRLDHPYRRFEDQVIERQCDLDEPYYGVIAFRGRYWGYLYHGPDGLDGGPYGLKFEFGWEGRNADKVARARDEAVREKLGDKAVYYLSLQPPPKDPNEHKGIPEKIGPYLRWLRKQRYVTRQALVDVIGDKRVRMAEEYHGPVPLEVLEVYADLCREPIENLIERSNQSADAQGSKPMPAARRFGAYLRGIRYALGVGPSDVGRLANVTHETIYNVENKKCWPTATVLKAYAQACNVPYAVIVATRDAILKGER